MLLKGLIFGANNNFNQVFINNFTDLKYFSFVNF
jgi:hypothetical protein